MIREKLNKLACLRSQAESDRVNNPVIAKYIGLLSEIESLENEIKLDCRAFVHNHTLAGDTLQCVFTPPSHGYKVETLISLLVGNNIQLPDKVVTKVGFWSIKKRG